jgi:hypothetical protein
LRKLAEWLKISVGPEPVGSNAALEEVAVCEIKL